MSDLAGLKTLQSFAPNWGDAEVLEATLVGRRKLVDRLEELAIDGANGGALHQRMVYAPRGSGKTHLIRVLHNRLWANEAIKDKLLIIYLLEDEMGVASFLDFVVRLLRGILRWYPGETALEDSLEELYDMAPQNQEFEAVRLLLRTLGDRRALILMENLGLMFGDKTGFGEQGQKALRDLLQQHHKFMIIATSQSLTPAVTRQASPFHNFFRSEQLKALSLEEAMELYQAIAEAYGREDVAAYLQTPEGRGRIAAVFDFTGGNHRLLVTFYELLGAKSVAKFSQLFIENLNPLRPYYQEQMRALSAQQQKIVQFLSLTSKPRTVKEIARGCLAADNVISRQLKDLKDLHFVSSSKQGRESYYEMSEALFRIVLQADLEQQGAPTRLFIDFLGNFYTAKELVRRCQGYRLLGQQHGNTHFMPFNDEAAFYEHALRIYHPDSLGELTRSSKETGMRQFFGDLKADGAFKDIVDFASHVGEERDAYVYHTEAQAFAELGKIDDALEAAVKALQLDNQDVDAHLVAAKMYAKKGEQDLAIDHANQAASLAPDDGFVRYAVGVVAYSVGDLEGALEHFEITNEVRPDFVDGWLQMGATCLYSDRLQEAEAAFRHVLELEPKSVRAHWGLGTVAYLQGQGSEAESHFTAAINLDGTDVLSICSRGVVRLLRQDFAAAIGDNLATLNIDDSSFWPKWDLISAYLGLGDLANANNAIGRAVDSLREANNPQHLVSAISGNLEHLLRFGPTHAWRPFLAEYLPAVMTVDKTRVEQALPITVFALLRKVDELSSERLEAIIVCLDNEVWGDVETSVAQRFLSIGHAYFKEGDTKALVQLPSEERTLFVRELGLPSA